MTPPTTDTSREAVHRSCNQSDLGHLSDQLLSDVCRALLAERDALRDQLAAARDAALEEAFSVAESKMRKHAKEAYSGEPVRVFKGGEDTLSQSAAKCYCAGEIAEEIRALKSTTPAPKASDSECPSCGEYDCGECECECECDPAPREVTVQEAARVSPIADLLPDATARAEKAMNKFPQPNYIISKWAEESGEVTKALIHAAEGRETWENIRGELVDTLAMLHRLFVEGDEVHGLPPLRALANEEQSDG